MCSAIDRPMPPKPPVIRCTPCGRHGESSVGGRATDSRLRIQRSPRRNTTTSVCHSASSSAAIASTRLRGGGCFRLRGVDVDGESGDVAELARNDPHRAVQQRPLREERVGGVEGVDAARHERQPHRLGTRRQRTGEEQHAGVVALDGLAVGDQLVVPTEAEAPAAARPADRGHVDDGGRQRVFGRQGIDERDPVVGASRVDLEATAGPSLEALTQSHRHDPAACGPAGRPGPRRAGCRRR